MESHSPRLESHSPRFSRPMGIYPIVSVIFQVKAETVYGEQVFVCGSTASLGKWNTYDAIKMDTKQELFPHWTVTLSMPVELPFEYKYIIKDIRGSIKWEPCVGNRRYEPLSPYTFIYDGHFGKKHTHKEIITPERMNEIRKMLKNPSVTPKKIVELSSGPDDLKDEVHALKDTLLERDTQITKLKRELSIFQGEDLGSLTTDVLKELAAKSRKTYHRANTVMMQRIEEEKQKLLQSNNCQLCVHGKIDTVLIPCGHVALCYDCATKIRGHCFVCNAHVDSVHRVFIK